MQFRLFVFLAFVSLTACGWTFYLISIRKNDSPTAKAVVFSLRAYLLLTMGYLVNNTFEMLVSSAEVTSFLAKLDYFFISFIPVVWLMFALNYTGHGTYSKFPKNWFLLLVPVVTTLLALTNDFHQLIWRSFEVQNHDPFLLFHAYEYGTWFWIHALYSNTVILVGLHLIVVTYFKSQSVLSRQTLVIVFGIFIPIVYITLYVLRVFPAMIKDFSPICFAFSGLAFAIGVFQYNFLDLMPVARAILVENLEDGVMVLDKEHRIVDINPAMSNILHLDVKASIGKEVGEVFAQYIHCTDDIRSQTGLRQEVQINTPQGLRDFILRTTCFPNKVGKLITLRDITSYKEVEFALRSSQSELESRIEERTAELSALNTTLEQRITNRTHDLAALYSVSSVASEVQDLNGFLQKSLDRTIRALGSELGLIYLVNEPEKIQGDSDGETSLRLELKQFDSASDLNQVLFLLHDQELLARVLKLDETLLQPAEAVLSRLNALPLNPNDGALTTTGSWVPMALLLAPLRTEGAPNGVLVLSRTKEALFTSDEISLLTTIGNQIGMAVSKYQLQSKAELNKVLEERQLMAANLHDSVSQTLYGLAAFSDIGLKHLDMGNYPDAKNVMQRISNETRTAIKEFRLFIHNLKPVELETKGLVAAIQQRLDSVEGRSDVQTSLVAETPLNLNPRLEEALYRIAQEALNNTIRHAHAANVSVRIKMDSGWVKMVIEDDGCGFNVEKVRSGSQGLANMRKRSQDLGGSFMVASSPDQGTKLEVALPSPLVIEHL